MISDESEVRERARASFDMRLHDVFPDLKRIAYSRLFNSGNLTLLSATELVNETFLKLATKNGVLSQQRGEFLAYCSRTMRSIIIDYVRARGRDKRGAGASHTELQTEIVYCADRDNNSAQILRVHEAIDALSELDARMAQIVEMRYFGGFDDDEICAALSITDRTVRREWQKARLFLAEALI